MGVKIREIKGYLYLDIIKNRKHHYESLHVKISENPTVKKEQIKFAEMCRAKRELQVATGEWGFEDRIGGKKTLIVYMREISQGRSVKDPLVRAIRYVEEFRDNGLIQLSAIDARWINDFQKWLLAHPKLSQMTASHYSNAVRHTLNQAVRDRLLADNPADAVKGIARPETDKVTLTIDELQTMAKTPLNGELRQEVKRGFLFACYTGLRVSDISSLQWKDIEQRQITQGNSCANWIKKKQVKTKHIVEIPLAMAAWQLIQPRNFPDMYVFPKLAQSGTHTDSYIKDWAKKAGIEKKISWHTARRSAATILLESGVDPLTIQRILGHTKIDTTTLYAKSTDGMKSRAVDALPDFTSDLTNEQKPPMVLTHEQTA